MTVSATTPYVAYAGAGTSGPFAIPFRFLANADLVVSKIDAAGVETTLTGNTISGAGDDDGGELHTAAVVAIGETLKVYRQTVRAQTAQYVANGPFPAATHERALDKAMLVDQEQDRDLDRALKVPLGVTPLVWPDLTDSAGKVVGFDADRKLALFSSASQVALADNVTWLRPEMGAISRTIAAKVAERISVLDFIPVFLHAAIQAGICDVDLAEWIQNAIDCRPHYDQFLTRGIRLVFPAGAYPTSTLDMSGRHGVHLDGDGMFAAELVAFGTDPVIQGVGSAGEPISKASIKGFTIRGGGKANANAHGISLSWTNRCAIEDVIFYGCRNGLDLHHNWQLTLTNVHADGGGADQNYIGTYMGPSTLANIDNAVIATGLTMQGCQHAGFRLVNFNGSKFTSCEAPGGDYGWYLGDPATGTTKITWGHFVNCLADTNNIAGWHLKKGAATAFEQVQFANCWCGNSGGENWLIDGCDGVVIACPEVITSQKEGMKLIGSTRCIISNPIVRRYNGLGGGYAAIHLVDSQFCVVDGGNTETVFAGGGIPYGVKESGTSDNNRIAGGLHNGGYLLIGASTYLDEDTRAEKGGITGAISYSRTEAGAVSRYVGDRLRETISVLDFIPVNLHAGIRARTNTTDLWAFCQAAQNAAAPYRQPVFWAGGQYRVHSGLVITGASTGIIGDGRTLTQISPVGDFGDVIHAYPIGGAPNIQGLTFRDFSVYTTDDTTSGACLHIEKGNLCTVRGLGLYARYGGMLLSGTAHSYFDLDLQTDANFAAFRAGSYLLRIQKGATGVIPAELHFLSGDWRGQTGNNRLDIPVDIACGDGIWFHGGHWGFAGGDALRIKPEDDTATLVNINVSKVYLDTVLGNGAYVAEPSAAYTGQFGGHDLDFSYIYNVGLDGVRWDNGTANIDWSTLRIAGSSRIGRDGVSLVQGSAVTMPSGFHIGEFGWLYANRYGINAQGTYSDINIGRGVIERGAAPNVPAAGVIFAAGVDKFTQDQVRVRGCAATVIDNSVTPNKSLVTALNF